MTVHEGDGASAAAARGAVEGGEAPGGATPGSEGTRENRATKAHALSGIGIVVTDAQGRVLLGRSARRGGVWELPGGKNDAGEELRQAAARELAEETGLVAEPEAVRLAAVLVDVQGGLPRLTFAARVLAFTGEARVVEPELIERWEWHAPERLPRPLFTPSAQVLAQFWPQSLPELPPVHRYPLAEAEAD